MKTLLAILALGASMAFAQTVNTARMDGSVTDPQGAVVVGADVTVVNSNTATNFKTKTGDRGQWAVPALPQGVYRVSVAMKGFRTTVVEDVVMDAGVPVTVNAKLQIGQVTETVEVSGAAALVQADNATINSTIEAIEVQDLPNISRNAMDVLVSQPGMQTATEDRYSSVNGLPNNGLNVTLDGLDMQDYNKNSNGYYSRSPINLDMVDQITMSTSAAGADSTGEGAAQIKFITKSGTNQFHGGAYWQVENTDLNANEYFNTINHLPRNAIQLNQNGFHVGGPILKNKLFFFTDIEFLFEPDSAAFSRTVINTPDMSGNYTYPDSSGVLHTVNVLTLAKAAGFNATPDPIISQTLSQIASYYGNGILVPNTSTADYNRSTLNYGVHAENKQYMSMERLDYNINSKHNLSVSYSYDKYDEIPDIGNSIVPIYPGTGDVVGTTISTGQHSIRAMGTISLRSALSPHLTNEFHSGLYLGVTVFQDGLASDAPYSEWKGYVPSLGFSLSGVTASSGSSRRSSPPKQASDTMSYVKGTHMFTFGGNFTQENLWYETVGDESIPDIAFGAATGDPVVTGSTNIFTTTNFPGASSTYLSDAAGLYATLTGRVSSISRQVVLGPNGTYGSTPLIDNIRQREFGMFAQDAWRVLPNLSVTFGLRYEQQEPFQDLNHVYSTVSTASVWGISGIGNMFMPGTLTGVNPTYEPLAGNNYNTLHKLLPSAGFAWQIPEYHGILGILFGHHQGASVLRAGYGMASIREGASIVRSIYDGNQGLTYTTSVNPTSYPQYFGAAGSVLFSQATLPSQPYPTSPTYPMTPTGSNELNSFDPNLKLGYVQSWNVGFQREIGKSNVIEVRYTGNHGLHEWRQVNLNEVDLFQSGFLQQAYIAQNNLAIARGGNINANTSVTNFGDQGLPGQQPIPIISTAFGSTTTTSYATDLRQNRMATIADAIYANATYMGNLTKAGYPANLFVVNPAVASGGDYLVTNWGKSFYDGMQVEFRRRLTTGLSLSASYVFSKSLADGAVASGSDSGTPTTFRNLGLDKGPSSFDIRNAIKYNVVYQLPFGTGRRFLSSGNRVLRQIVGGWQISAVGRTQSGTPSSLNTRGYGMDNNDAGVVLQNMTTAQLQSMVHIYKTTGANGYGLVNFLPQSLIQNSQAAFEANGLSWSNLNASAPYVGPQLAPNTFGYAVYLYAPWQSHFDLMLLKSVQLKEHLKFELRATAVNLLNMVPFRFGTVGASSAAFGQTTSDDSDGNYRVVLLEGRITF
jgi:hypothetical protein